MERLQTKWASSFIYVLKMGQLKLIYLLITLTTAFSQCGNTDVAKETFVAGETSVKKSDSSEETTVKMEQQSKKTLVIKGIFDSSGNRLISIERPVLYNREIPESAFKQDKGRYQSTIKYKTGDSLNVYFDGFVAGDRDETQMRHGFFELQLSVREDILWIRITDLKNGKMLKQFSNKDIVLQ